MIYHDFQGEKLSGLGFGAMRMPLASDGSVDEPQLRAIIRYAMENGINYYDTAWMYHNGESERIIGRVLKDYPRESYNLATKFPGFMLKDLNMTPAEVFEKQLEKCGVTYFDFYLLHNVTESSMEIFLDKQIGIIDYLKEQKRIGRIRHLGFSTHAQTDGLKKFLDQCGDDMEFCQIQLNYLDWTLQDAKGKYELLTERNIPVWVMEPVRGGALANLEPSEVIRLKNFRPNETAASWGFRFLTGLENVTVVLSGMSSMEQMVDNIQTFSNPLPLSTQEKDILFAIAEKIKAEVPCTACRYCCDGCPAGLEIPDLIKLYNQLRLAGAERIGKKLQEFPVQQQPSACLTCGKCSEICPQNIDVPHVLANLVEKTK